MSLESFKYKNNELVFWQITGEVMSTNKFSETEVWSSGGGGSVGPNGGQVSAPTVHSRAITNHEFWLKTTEGKEKPIQLTGCNIPLREGQKITLISAAKKDADRGYYSILVNHSAEKHWVILNANKLNNLTNTMTVGLGMIFLWSLVATGFIAYTKAMPYEGDHAAEAFFVWCLAFIPIFILWVITAALMLDLNPLDAHLEKLAQQAHMLT